MKRRQMRGKPRKSRRNERSVRFGIGYDIHKFSSGRKLILGGVPIAHPMGLLGHSDADVLAHAVADALLGAAGLGDIGTHFPDANEKFRDISSLLLLKEVGRMLEANGFEVVNVDSTVVLQTPKIAPFVRIMEANMASALSARPNQISVKATTNEGLGSIGSGEACAAYAVASLRSIA